MGKAKLDLVLRVASNIHKNEFIVYKFLAFDLLMKTSKLPNFDFRTTNSVSSSGILNETKSNIFHIQIQKKWLLTIVFMYTVSFFICQTPYSNSAFQRKYYQNQIFLYHNYWWKSRLFRTYSKKISFYRK